MDLMAMQPEDSGDPVRLQVLRDRLAGIQRSVTDAQGAAAAAHGMAARMSTGADWQSRRAKRMQQQVNEELLSRKAEQDEWFRGYLVRHHTRELQRAQAREQLARQRHARSGAGWPEVTRGTRTYR